MNSRAFDRGAGAPPRAGNSAAILRATLIVVGVLRVHPGGSPNAARRKLGITDPAGLADFDLAGHER